MAVSTKLHLNIFITMKPLDQMPQKNNKRRKYHNNNDKNKIREGVTVLTFVNIDFSVTFVSLFSKSFGHVGLKMSKFMPYNRKSNKI